MKRLKFWKIISWACVLISLGFQIHPDALKILEQVDGPYENYKKVYQEYVEFNKDESGSKYQAGVFFAYEACGLSFRKGSEIMDNMSKFVGHYIM